MCTIIFFSLVKAVSEQSCQNVLRVAESDIRSKSSVLGVIPKFLRDPKMSRGGGVPKNVDMVLKILRDHQIRRGPQNV